MFIAPLKFWEYRTGLSEVEAHKGAAVTCLLNPTDRRILIKRNVFRMSEAGTST